MNAKTRAGKAQTDCLMTQLQSVHLNESELVPSLSKPTQFPEHSPVVTSKRTRVHAATIPSEHSPVPSTVAMMNIDRTSPFSHTRSVRSTVGARQKPRDHRPSTPSIRCTSSLASPFDGLFWHIADAHVGGHTLLDSLSLFMRPLFQKGREILER